MAKSTMAEKLTASDIYLLTIPLLITVLIAIGLVLLNMRLMSLPEEASGTVVVVFPPNYSPATIYDAVLNSDGRLLNNTWFDSAWVVYSEQDGFVAQLKAQGAWAAFNPALLQSITISGCFTSLPDT